MEPKEPEDVLRLGDAEQDALPIKVKRNGTVKEYRLPLRGSLKMSDVMLFRPPHGISEDEKAEHGFDAFWQFANRYLPTDVLGDLTEGEFIQLYEAWDSMSSDGGPSQGE